MENKILYLALLLCSSYTQAQSPKKNNKLILGKVVAITDGDTFKLLDQDSTLHRIRVANIDCPERKQPFSTRAKQFTSDQIFGKHINVQVQSKDRYGRLIANVIYDDSLNLGHKLLKAGMAWHYVRYSKDKGLQAIEDDARFRKVGLWIDHKAIPPWEWRSKKKSEN